MYRWICFWQDAAIELVPRNVFTLGHTSLHAATCLKKISGCLQCTHLVDPALKHHDAATQRQLQRKLTNMHFLMHDRDARQALAKHVPALERNWHYIPYKLNVAYTPQQSTRLAAIAVQPGAGNSQQQWDHRIAKVRFAHTLYKTHFCAVNQPLWLWSACLPSALLASQSNTGPRCC
jgi:hypothetical protein